MKTLHAATTVLAVTTGGTSATSPSPPSRQDVKPEMEVVEQYSVRRVQESTQERGTSPLLEAGATFKDQRPDRKPRVTYEKERGYGTLAHEDPELATSSRPIRYLDLWPTTPETIEVSDKLDQWKARIPASPYPVDKAALMEQFRAGERSGLSCLPGCGTDDQNAFWSWRPSKRALRLASREKFDLKLPPPRIRKYVDPACNLR